MRSAIRHTSLFLMTLTIVAGCGGTAGSGHPQEGDRSSDQKVFDRLTANVWCNKEEVKGVQLLAPTSKRYTFRRDGTYDYSHVSDYPEEQGAGNWNFQRTSQDSGLISLSSGELLSFALHGNRLQLADMTLSACEPNADEGKKHTIANLPRIELDSVASRLTATTWRKANDDFDLYRMPTSVEFIRDARYHAIFRNGQCSFSGTWSLRKGSNNNLIRAVPENSCDERGKTKPSTYWSGARFEDGALIFDGSLYVRPSDLSSKGREWKLLYNNLSMTLEFTTPIRSGVTNTFTIQLKNIGGEALVIKSLSVLEMPIAAKADYYTAKKGERLLRRIELSSMVLDPGKSQTWTTPLTFSAVGKDFVTFLIDYAGATQPYLGRVDLMLAL